MTRGLFLRALVWVSVLMSILTTTVAFQVAPRPPSSRRTGRVATTPRDAGTLVSLGLLQKQRHIAISPTTDRKILQSTTDGTEGGGEKETSSSSPATVDYDALLKYHVSIVVQMTLMAASFAGLDAIVKITNMQQLPFPIVGALFYALSLKSRVFNPLNNQRPNMPTPGDDNKPSKGFRDRVMPKWTPPGVVFPIMWLLIIGPIRAYSSALVYETTHAFLHPSLLSFAFHLSVGDVWNTINNTDRRFGASVTGVLCVVASVVNAAYQYYTVKEFAGKLMALPLLWFAVATSLITATWRLNPNPTTGEPEPLYPIVGETKTEFSWFGGSSKE